MGPHHADTGSPGGTGHDNIEGSKDTPLHVWLHALCWIGWSWMVRPIYDSTLQIDLKNGPGRQAGEE